MSEPSLGNPARRAELNVAVQVAAIVVSVLVYISALPFSLPAGFFALGVSGDVPVLLSVYVLVALFSFSVAFLTWVALWKVSGRTDGGTLKPVRVTAVAFFVLSLLYVAFTLLYGDIYLSNVTSFPWLTGFAVAGLVFRHQAARANAGAGR